MRLTHISLTQFRCFPKAAWDLSPQFNVFIGENGSGKTTILEAVACALGTWLKQFPEVKERPISRDDFRVVAVLKSTQLVEQRQKHVVLLAKAELEGRLVSWFRSKVDGKREQSRKDDELTPLAKAASQAISEGKDITLPLISFYGTGRLWNVPNTQKPKLRKKRGEANRLEGYRLAVDPRTSPDLLIEWLTRQEWVAFQNRETNPLLEIVKKSILGCLDECEDIRYDAAHEAIMLSFRNGEYQNFSRLSDGQRNMMAMIADIAIKAATLNPHLGEKVLEETPGVVLIDELDLHLHPKWQRRIINDLKRTFPALQFIATTHSPFLIQSLEPGELFNLEGGDSGEYADQSIEDIAENVMGVEMPQKSERYQRMMGIAEEYYTLLRAPRPDKKRLKVLEEALNEASIPYSDDPAFMAQLKLKRELANGSH